MKNKRKLKIVLFGCSKSIRTVKKFKISNICETHLFILECIYHCIKLIINVYFLNKTFLIKNFLVRILLHLLYLMYI